MAVFHLQKLLKAAGSTPLSEARFVSIIERGRIVMSGKTTKHRRMATENWIRPCTLRTSHDYPYRPGKEPIMVHRVNMAK